MVSIGREAKFAFVSVNKKVDQKFYIGKSTKEGLKNPEPGSLICSEVSDATKDFYLVGQKTLQGIATPTHYQLLYKNIEEDSLEFMQKLQDLCYKQCYV